MVDFENSAFEVLDLVVKWDNFGVSKSFYKENQKFVKCNLLPFLFTYFDLSSSKGTEKYWADSENKVNKHFWPNLYPI